MKNTLKKTVFGLAILAMLLCLAGCPLFEDDEPFVPYDEIRTEDYVDGTKSITYFYSLNESDTVQFTISNGSTIIILSYSSASGSAQFDTIGIKDASVALIKEEGQNYARTPYSSAGNEVRLADMMGTYLPNTATWTLEFKYTADSSKDVIWEIPADKVTIIKDWIETTSNLSL